jgi:NAD(P)-dependent dehydrogenase (short-subunit alcohol dehydrogenase family)
MFAVPYLVFWTALLFAPAPPWQHRHDLRIADLGEDRLAAAALAVSAVASGSAAHVMTMATDVSRVDEMTRLEATVRERFGGTDVLMNNAGVQPDGPAVV